MVRYFHDILILMNKIALKLFSLNNVYSRQGSKTLLQNILPVTISGYCVMFLMFLYVYCSLSYCHLLKEMHIFYLSHHIFFFCIILCCDFDYCIIFCATFMLCILQYMTRFILMKETSFPCKNTSMNRQT